MRGIATRWFSVVLTLVVGVIVALQFGGLAAQRQADRIWRDRVQFAQNIERIRYYDELLTMSARMAAATGDRTYQVRYEKAVPELDAVLRDTMRLADAEARAAIATTDDANVALIEMETESFERLATGDRAAAYALLTSDRYAALKAEYSAGLAVGLRRIDANARAHSERAALLQVGALVAGALAALLLAVMWAAAARSLRRSHRARTHLEDQLRRHAQQDSLTGLANRRHFRDRLSAALELGDGEPMAVLFTDLDRFKLVNDSRGHAAGDDLLVEVARRIRARVDRIPGGVAARLGGDEFAVLLPGVDRAAAERFAERLVTDLAAPYLAAGHLRVTASVGLAMADPSLTNAYELLRQADLAMYDAKLAGANRWCARRPDPLPVSTLIEP